VLLIRAYRTGRGGRAILRGRGLTCSVNLWPPQSARRRKSRALANYISLYMNSTAGSASTCGRLSEEYDCPFCNTSGERADSRPVAQTRTGRRHCRRRRPAPIQGAPIQRHQIKNSADRDSDSDGEPQPANAGGTVSA